MVIGEVQFPQRPEPLKQGGCEQLELVVIEVELPQVEQVVEGAVREQLQLVVTQVQDHCPVQTPGGTQIVKVYSLDLTIVMYPKLLSWSL